MRIPSLVSVATALAVAGLLNACSSSNPELRTGSEIPSAAGGASGVNAGPGSSSGVVGEDGTSGASSDPTHESLGDALGTGNPEGVASIGEACGTTDQAAELTPIHMIFVYDKSSSMGKNSGVDEAGNPKVIDNTELRWNPVKQGMLDFFANAKASNVKASLTFFAAPGDKEQTCAHDYSVPNVPMTSLESPEPLVTALNAEIPSGGTPTLSAVVGGVNYAKQLLAQHPGSQAMVVLVTDGEPAVVRTGGRVPEPDCAPPGINLKNTVTDIASFVGDAAAGTPAVRTHVIGIGSVAALKTIAEAAGTQFVQIDPSDATLTRNTILSELTKIQTKTISCNIPLPDPTASFDKNRVNVVFEHSNGVPAENLYRSDDCTGSGWRFDDATNPTFIQLCPDTCQGIQGDLDGKVKIVLGCPTRVIE